MRLSRRGLILGGSLALAGCATAPQTPQTAAATLPLAPAPQPVAPEIQVGDAGRPVVDPRGEIRKELLDRALAALDIHHHKLPHRDRIYLVDFKKFSGDERLYEVDMVSGAVTVFRTTHGRGSDPAHTGFAERFSNEPDSHMSSVGAYATAGPNWGPQQGANVLLDGLEYTNNLARDRAIIVHGADYADPDFLAREGKLGRSYGCFSVAHADLQPLRERMGEGRLLFAWA
ncbi:murein L,D-transpeptidase catalytic domain-containing protein [Brevundimonas balnearis]|uniref:Murein L,D-transpeptidase catalytic domain-containing protein n=1 Tax=Brevundimonas balnearis TaxID=1572858 RepID=A0ABV6R1U2_9CAUL